MTTVTPRKTRSHGPAEDIDLDHPAGGAEADSHLIGVHPPTRLEREVSETKMTEKKLILMTSLRFIALITGMRLISLFTSSSSQLSACESPLMAAKLTIDPD
jgi:hypothetical protein